MILMHDNDDNVCIYINKSNNKERSEREAKLTRHLVLVGPCSILQVEHDDFAGPEASDELRI